MQNSLYWFDRASKIFPQDPEIWYNLGGVAFSLGDYAKARASFERCLQLNPNHAQAKAGLSNCPPVNPNSPAPTAVPVPEPVSQVPANANLKADNTKTLSVSKDEVLQDPNQKLPAVLNGYFMLYNRNHQKTKDGVFKENRFMDGKNYVYNQNGQLTSIEVYKNGFFAGNATN